VPELTIRPTAKFITAGAALAAVVFVGLEVLYLTQWTGSAPNWVMAFPALIMVWPAARWLRRRFTKAVISGDRLRYEVGMASRSTRNIQLSKIQDVRVDQSLMHRLFDIGDLSIETAGETSRLTLRNVDKPQQLADEIMSRAQKGTATV
jgi:uncharacterized membrane protein YdbT with pleckstrin-like domain